MNIKNEPEVTTEGVIIPICEDSDEYQFIKKQNHILTRENQRLKKKIETKISEITFAQKQKSFENKFTTTPGESESNINDQSIDSRDTLIEDYERQIINLNKKMKKQEQINKTLANKMKV